MLQRDAELVVALARGDLGVGMRVDIRVDADGDGGLDAEGAGDVVQPRQLGLALDVKREDAVFQGQLDLGLGLAHAGKDALLDIPAGSDDAANFAAAHEIETRPQVREVPQHGQARIRLHRIAELEIQSREAGLEPAAVVGHRRGAVDVGRGTVQPGDGGEVDRLTLQLGARVMKVMHGKKA